MGLAEQLSHPSGFAGALVGRGMAKGNAALSRWVVQQASSALDDTAERVAELGPGPGVGLEALLVRFPTARVWGIDVSSLMVSQSLKRNRSAVTTGRLVLLEGGVPSVSAAAPADQVMANHVLYFWADPAAEMTQIRACLRPGGIMAVGYQLRQNMPRLAQRRFPHAGHRLYETEDEVTQVATAAGFGSVDQLVKGPANAPEGRVMLATA
jgi:trans-aconitate methyltransferase